MRVYMVLHILSYFLPLELDESDISTDSFRWSSETLLFSKY